jgi:hypothetical protein
MNGGFGQLLPGGIEGRRNPGPPDLQSHRAHGPPADTLARDECSSETLERAAVRVCHRSRDLELERRRRVDRLRTARRFDHYPDLPERQPVDRGEHAEAAALPRTQEPRPRQRDLRRSDGQQQSDWKEGRRRAHGYLTTTTWYPVDTRW